MQCNAGFADPYIAEEHFSIITQLIRGYGHPEVALNCGSMIREAIRHEKIARRLLFSEAIWPFFDSYVHLPNFDVASDSFATLKDLLMRHRAVAAEFLEKEYDHVSEEEEDSGGAAVVLGMNGEGGGRRGSPSVRSDRAFSFPFPSLGVQVFARYKTLLSSDNYVTKRMSLKLLGEILLDRSNFNVMCVRPSVSSFLPRPVPD